MQTLFPQIKPYARHELAVDGPHVLYVDESGSPDGLPVVFVHGGPGSGCDANSRCYFDPGLYRIITFDQRGCGRSTPHASLDSNTTWDLVADMERIRLFLGIEKWVLFGGSWGSTLALAYGQAHPAACLGFVLRGIFLCTQAEIDWFIEGVRWFYPELYEEFAAPIPAEERGDLLAAYVQRILSSDPAVYWPAARAWSRFEGRRVYLMPQPEDAPNDALDLGVGRLESHYMANLGFFEEDQLIRNMGRIAHLPAVIVQGRYDAICPPLSAYRLQQAWPGAQLEMIPDAGHGALEHGIASALVRATERFVPGRGFA